MAQVQDNMVQISPIFQAVIFDLDGLLLDTERLYLEAFRRTQLSLGLEVDTDAYLGLVGLNSADLRSALAGRLRQGESADEFLRRWSLEIAAIFENPVATKEGARELCVLLSDAGLPCAVATSSDADKASVRMERAGLRDFFAVLVGGDQVSRGKPAPDIYLEAARRLGVSPDGALAFEDSDVGVQAALSAGMVTVQVPDLARPPANGRVPGHLIAPSILAGARASGLVTA